VREKRRAILFGALTAFALQAVGQTRTWRVGFLALRHVTHEDSDYYYGPLIAGLRDFGYVEGRNLVIEWRSAEGQVDRLRALADELVRVKVDLIVVAGTQATAAAQAATSTIPIVMGSTGDPLGSGFVKSLARPGGNITGFTNLSSDTGPKQLQILASIVPRLGVAGVLINPTNSSHPPILESIQAAGRVAGIRIVPVKASNLEEIDAGFPLLMRQKAGGFIVALDALFNQYGGRISELAIKHRIASVFTGTGNVEQGGLVSYGQNIRDNFRQTAVYIDKIFKGADPATLPVEQTTTFEMVINRRTAKAIGVRIPDDLLVRANRIID